MSLAAKMERLNLDDHERMLLRKKFGMNEDGTINTEPSTDLRPSYTIWFPEDVKRGSIEHLRGPVPAVGDRVYLKSYGRQEDILPDYDWKYDYREWYVKKVSHSINVQSTERDQLILKHSVTSIEVLVDYNRWGHWWRELTLRWYHWPKNKVRDYFRYRSWRKPANTHQTGVGARQRIE